MILISSDELLLLLEDRFPNTIPTTDITMNDVCKIQGQQQVINHILGFIDAKEHEGKKKK